MAAIFQIRRGSGSVSLVDGELYLHKSSGSLQVSVGDGNPITLARLDQPNSGSLNIGGDITASNMFVTGNLMVSGNLYLGDSSTNDNIQTLGLFNTDLKVATTNVYSIGSSAAVWKEVHATAITGAIAATNGVVSGSAQMVGILSSLNSYTSSNDTTNSTQTNRLDQLSTASGSAIGRLNNLESTSASVNTTNTTQNTRLSRIEESTASLNAFTASNSNTSLNTYTASVNSKFSILESVTSSYNNTTASLNSYTASLKTAMIINGSDVTLNGNLTVAGTTTQINSTQVNIGDNIIELNFGGASTTAGIYTKDATGTLTSGSFLWDATNDRWIAGQKGTEAKVLVDGLGVVSGSSQIAIVGTSDYTSLFTGIASATSSLNVYSASIDNKFVAVQSSTSSLNAYTASQTTINTNVSASASIYENKFSIIGNVTSSFNSATASLNTFSASINGHVSDINEWTASQNSKDVIILNITSSYNTFTASINGHVSDINVWTGSVNTKFSTLQNITASLNSATASLFVSASQLTASLTSLSQSVYGLYTTNDLGIFAGRVGSLESTASYLTTTLNTYTGSNDNKWSTLQNVTSSLIAATSSYETKGRGIISSSAQIDALFNLDGIISGSSQITSLLPAGVVSGSGQVSGSIFSTISGDILIATNGVATIQANSIALGVDTTGNYMTDLTQGTGVTITHTPGEGSNATIAIGQAVATNSNVQFGSIGVGTAASGVSGEIRATGDITAYYSSDERLKENIQPIQNALSKVEAISGNTYDWKEGFENIHSHKGNDLGVIAQEVQSILPEIVTERETGYLAVDYVKLVPVLIEAIKELSTKVKELESK